MPASLRDLYSRSSLSSPSGASATSPASPLDLTRYSLPSLRQYELAQQMVSQQGAVSKLLGECLWSGGARSQVVHSPDLWPKTAALWVLLLLLLSRLDHFITVHHFFPGYPGRQQ